MTAEYLQAACSQCGLGVYRAELANSTEQFGYYCSRCGRVAVVIYLPCDSDTQGHVTLPAPFERRCNDGSA